MKSREELMLANWLFYNGVTYRYERNYEHDTADASHSQYQPDFYFPDIDFYHEHFALNRHGQEPRSGELVERCGPAERAQESREERRRS